MCTNYRWDFWFFSAMNTKKKHKYWLVLNLFHLVISVISPFWVHVLCVWKTSKSSIVKPNPGWYPLRWSRRIPCQLCRREGCRQPMGKARLLIRVLNTKAVKNTKGGRFHWLWKNNGALKKVIMWSLTEIYLGCLGWKGLFNKFAFHAPLHPSHQSQIQIPNLLDNSWKQRLIHEGVHGLWG